MGDGPSRTEPKIWILESYTWCHDLWLPPDGNWSFEGKFTVLLPDSQRPLCVSEVTVPQPWMGTSLWPQAFVSARSGGVPSGGFREPPRKLHIWLFSWLQGGEVAWESQRAPWEKYLPRLFLNLLQREELSANLALEVCVCPRSHSRPFWEGKGQLHRCSMVAQGGTLLWKEWHTVSMHLLGSMRLPDLG